MSEEEFFEENFNQDVYDKKVVDELFEDDEISNSEESFLKGYDNDANQMMHRDDYDSTVLCPNCGKVLDINTKICPRCGQNINEAVVFKKNARGVDSI